jgi:hypothetical protein
MTPDKLLTCRAAAELFGCVPATIRQRAGDPRDPLTGIKLGRDWLFEREHGVRGRGQKAGAR